MADLPTEFWGGYIVLLTVVSLIAMVWLVFSVYFAPDHGSEAPSETWDETLKEGTTPAPLWWFWLILGLLAVTVVYLMLYPGLGMFKGALHWSQGGELSTKLEDFDAQFGADRARIAMADVASLGTEEPVMNSAWHVFNVNCASCHGKDAAGQANLFPNLTDDEWQWGGSEAQIRQTLMMGRQGVMPPWQAALGDDGVAALADYVLALSRGQGRTPELEDSRTTYRMYCSACHADDGSGNPLLGAPPLNNGTWLYGGDRDAIIESIGAGRTGVMPSFGGRLDETQIQMLIAWILAGAEPRQ